MSEMKQVAGMLDYARDNGLEVVAGLLEALLDGRDYQWPRTFGVVVDELDELLDAHAAVKGTREGREVALEEALEETPEETPWYFNAEPTIVCVDICGIDLMEENRAVSEGDAAQLRALNGVRAGVDHLRAAAKNYDGVFWLDETGAVFSSKMVGTWCTSDRAKLAVGWLSNWDDTLGCPENAYRVGGDGKLWWSPALAEQEQRRTDEAEGVA